MNIVRTKNGESTRVVEVLHYFDKCCIIMIMADAGHPLDKLSVYGDYSALREVECLNAVQAEIQVVSDAELEDYKIIAVEKLRGIRRLRLGKYVTHLVEDPQGAFTIQAWANSIPGSTSMPTKPRADNMSIEDRRKIERAVRTMTFPVLKSAFHPDFDK